MDTNIAGMMSTEDNPMLSSPIAALSPEAFRDLCASIMIMMPRQANVDGGLLQLWALWGRMGIVVGDCLDSHGGFIEIQRGNIERQFLQYCETHQEIKYLVMVDSDEQFCWDAPMRLAQWGLPIVSGVVPGYSPQRGIFACFMDYDENGVARFPTFAHNNFMPERGIKKIHAAGAGLISVRKDVLETILNAGELPFMVPEEMRKESYRRGYVLQGEDMSFCQRAREPKPRD